MSTTCGRDIANVTSPVVACSGTLAPVDTSPGVLAIDTGGTFTDFVWASLATGQLTSAKVPSDPSALPDVCTAGLRLLNKNLRDARRIVHGTTLITNTVLEEDGARVATVTTAGHR